MNPDRTANYFSKLKNALIKKIQFISPNSALIFAESFTISIVFCVFYPVFKRSNLKVCCMADIHKLSEFLKNASIFFLDKVGSQAFNLRACL